jgi:hypothetical protein
MAGALVPPRNKRSVADELDGMRNRLANALRAQPDVGGLQRHAFPSKMPRFGSGSFNAAICP